jgi:hypothetical protein
MAEPTKQNEKQTDERAQKRVRLSEKDIAEIRKTYADPEMRETLVQEPYEVMQAFFADPKNMATRTEAEELAMLEVEVERLERRAKLNSLRARGEELRKVLDKAVEETFVTGPESTGPKGIRIPAKFKGAIRYLVRLPYPRAKDRVYAPGEEITLIDERPSRALERIVESEKSKALATPVAPRTRAADQAV